MTSECHHETTGTRVWFENSMFKAKARTGHFENEAKDKVRPP